MLLYLSSRNPRRSPVCSSFALPAKIVLELARCAGSVVCMGGGDAG